MGGCRGRYPGRGGAGRGGALGGLRDSQAVRRPRQHLQGLVQHLEAALPVMLVGVAVEQQAIQRGPQRQVILGPCSGRGGSGGAPVRGSGDGGASSWGSTGPGGPQGALGTRPPVWDTPGLMPQSRTAGGTAWRSSHRTSSSASLRHTQSCPSRAGPRAAGVTPDRGKHISPFGTEGSGAPPGRHLRCCPPSPTCLTCTRCPQLPLTPPRQAFSGPAVL